MYADIETIMKRISKARHPFERLDLTREEALDLFAENRFKTHLLKTKVSPGGLTSAYRIGYFVDLCTGPHVAHTGQISHVKLLKNSSTYWLGNSENESLQRIYGIAFPDKNQLKDFLHQREEAAKRDHRLIGQQQELFFWNTKYAPGSAFFLPHGATDPVWPEGRNTIVKVEPAEYCAGNSIYTAFVRQFGATEVLVVDLLAEEVAPVPVVPVEQGQVDRSRVHRRANIVA